MDQVKRLYDVLVRDGHYTKSFEEFKGRFENEDYQQRVFDVVSKEGLFTKGINEFKSKFVVKKQSVTPPSTSFASDEISLGTPESQFDLTAPKSYSDILKNQAVDESDEGNIRKSRSIELQQIQQIAEALGLQDTSEKSVLDELDKINQFEKDLKAKSGQQEKFGKFDKSFFDSEEYKDYRVKKDAIKDIIGKLHQGLSAEEAKERFEKEIGDVSPSEIADIEQTLILGAHGPRRLHVIVVGNVG